MNGLAVGRTVHYVSMEGVHLMAHVVKVWSKESGLVNLHVHIDESEYTGNPLFPVTSINYSEEPKPNTWHWCEPA